MSTHTEKLKLLARDLTREYPRSPRETLGGYVLAARTLDKCRAAMNGTAGEYHWDCPLGKFFFDFTGIAAKDFGEYVATGATDEEVAQWITTRSKVKDRGQIVAWNNKLRDLRLSDLPVETQLYMEDYIPQFVPRNRPVYSWFDVYDLEEERI